MDRSHMMRPSDLGISLSDSVVDSSDFAIGELDLDIETLNRLPEVPTWHANCTTDCTQNTACNCDYWSSVGSYFVSCCCS
jgi:hypothetical protein